MMKTDTDSHFVYNVCEVFAHRGGLSAGGPSSCLGGTYASS